MFNNAEERLQGKFAATQFCRCAVEICSPHFSLLSSRGGDAIFILVSILFHCNRGILQNFDW